MRTIKSALGFGYPIPRVCQMCGECKATVCVQRHAPIATHQIGWMNSKDNFFYCVNCNMRGDGR